MKLNKLKSIFISSALVVSILFTGCSNNTKNTVINQTQVKDSTSSTNNASNSYQSSLVTLEL